MRRTADLLIGRVSIPDGTYFLTLCAAKRRACFTRPEVAPGLKRTLDELHASADFLPIAATAMPDHLHVLGTLGRRLSLARALGKFKAQTRRVLSALGAEWQENFYDHHLRSNGDQEPFARYIFLNPYRAGLISLGERWPHWWRWGETRFLFENQIAETGSIPAAWLHEPEPAGAVDL